MNQLFYGDCLTIMRDLPPASVDLIYLDPPFNSNQAYNAIYKDETGRPLPDQIEAFCDLWSMDAERERAIRHLPVLLREEGIDDATVEAWRLWMAALRNTQPRLLAYLSYMAPRLAVMKRLLRPAGSIYLHCDTTASHYIKVMMDGIFGHDNFRNEIVWKRTSAHGNARRFGPVHDTVLFYSRSAKHVWHSVKVPHDKEYVAKHYRYEDARGRYRVGDLTASGIRHGQSGEAWHGINPTDAGRHWALPRKALAAAGMSQKANTLDALDALDAAGYIHWPRKKGGKPAFKRYLNLEGMALQDVWVDIPPVTSAAVERMGYPTQKPLALLERIIKASTDKGGMVLDPFAGCATTIEAAHRLGRQWMGIDIAIHAVKRVAAVRLGDRLKLKEGQDFRISGVPRTLEGAKDLWARDTYHFQKWAVEEVDGFVTSTRTADGGIDGRLYFDVPNDRDLHSMVLEVKGGAKVAIADLRTLHSVLERDEASMAGLIVMDALGDRQARSFGALMAEAGDLEVLGKPYPRMQILSVSEILAGRRFQTPTPLGRTSTNQAALALG